MTWYRDEEGNYVRTVTCSYCWTRGHNRTKCPDRAENIEKQRADDPDSYNVKRYDEEQKRKKTRCCSYCGTEGHNVTTCEAIKGHLESEIDLSIVYRALAHEHIKASGLGLGALIHIPEYYDENYNVVPAAGFITHIVWDRITHENKKNYYGVNCFVAKMQVKDRYGYTNLEIPMPYHPDLSYNEQMRYDYSVAVPSDTVEPPDGWFDEPDKDMIRRFRNNLKAEGRYHVERRLEEAKALLEAEEQVAA
tara:strand:- start:54 stop:800 length:747 start_codon:yes stop_codon:yes gene_type:complete